MGKLKLLSLVGQSTNPNAVKKDPTGLDIFLGGWGNNEVPWDAQPDYPAVKEVYRGLGNDEATADLYAFKVLKSGIDVAKSEGVDFKADVLRYLAKVPDTSDISSSQTMQTAQGQPLNAGSFWTKNKNWILGTVITVVVIGIVVVIVKVIKENKKAKS